MNQVGRMTILDSKTIPLTLELTRREIEERYSNQILGILWAFIHPAVLILVYIFLFVVVFRVKIGGTAELPLDYTTYLLTGLAPWLVMSEVLNKSGGLMASSSNIVKQVVFPLHILPVKAVLSSLPGFFVSLGILVTYVLATQEPHQSMLLLPVLMVLQIILMIGLTYFISSLGVFFKDLKDFVQVFSFVSMYLMPLFYLPSAVPGGFKFILYFNPFSYMIWSYQDLVYFGDFRHWWAFLTFALFSLSTYYFGRNLFNKLKPSFADVV